MTNVTAAPERLDVPAHGPTTKEEWEHHARYAWAASIVRGAVLDVACGTGHGAQLLSRNASVTGVDKDVAAVELARTRVTGRFTAAQMPPIPAEDAAFDYVVCFETIEHVANDRVFIGELRRVLRPEGRLLISTPNEEVSAPGGVPQNPWHVREYTLASLVTLLHTAGAFEVRGIYAQSLPGPHGTVHRVASRAYRLPGVRPGMRRHLRNMVYGTTDVVPFHGGEKAPAYWIVVADRTKVAQQPEGADGRS